MHYEQYGLICTQLVERVQVGTRCLIIIAGFRYQPVGDEAGQYKQTRNNGREKLEVCSILGTVC